MLIVVPRSVVIGDIDDVLRVVWVCTVVVVDGVVPVDAVVDVVDLVVVVRVVEAAVVALLLMGVTVVPNCSWCQCFEYFSLNSS